MSCIYMRFPVFKMFYPDLGSPKYIASVPRMSKIMIKWWKIWKLTNLSVGCSRASEEYLFIDSVCLKHGNKYRVSIQ